MLEEQLIPEAHYLEAAQAIRQRIAVAPTIGLILGSGLGPLVEEIENPVIIPYEEIPHWPRSTVMGHIGQLVFGKLEGHDVVAMQGRIHFYEGYSMAQVTLPVRVMRLLGVNTLILTNAAGGLNPHFNAGDIMVIEDHINIAGMAGHHPLVGPNIGSFGPRFSIHTRMYNPTLRKLACQVAETNSITLREGVYVALSGPSFETPAEVRMLRMWGGDTVGMSTAHEAIVAYHAGMRVLGFSSVTNASLDSTASQAEVSHEEVLRAGKLIVPRLAALLRGVLREMPPYDPSEMENHPE
ncbi:MAG TPA: purine-nucleoside phosphorylase [Aggregatilineaceae bacterium]|nr:purine-nucleoside phosphorylase [Aggregatilineaceae bacterium]